MESLADPLGMRCAFASLVLLILAAGLAPGCDGSSATPRSRIGNLDDRSYGGLREKPPRPSASGRPVAMTRFEGRFVWADYAAPWCSVCAKQTSQLAQVRSRLDGDLEFLTVMTSDMDGYGDPASEATARRWAARYRLATDRVVAADLTSMTVPRHVLFSPDGQMIFEWTGYFSAEQIREVVERRMDDWHAWKRSGDRAHWMKGGAS